MVRYVVTMTDGIRWELSARDSVDAAQRAERSHGWAPAAVPGARYGSSTLPTWHFTMPASAGSPEDLEIMLRDGYDAEARGTEESEGHQYVWVEYQMADEAAQQWYSVYPNIGARRVGSRRTAGARYSEIEQWCDQRGLVMKDFPDSLIELAAVSNNVSLLEGWLAEGNQPRTEGLGDDRDFGQSESAGADRADGRPVRGERAGAVRCGVG